MRVFSVAKKVNAVKLYVGCLVIGVLFLFIWCFSYINEPVGDDVACYFEGCLTLYLDEYEDDLGAKITNLSQVMSSLKFAYVNWTGRVPGYFLCYFGKMLPKIIQALLTAGIFVSNTLLASRIICKDWRKTLSAPLMTATFFFLAYWYRPSLSFSYMWTMTSIYSFGVMLCLLYYNMAVIDYEQGKEYRLWILQFVGILAGFSHEVISFCLIVAIGVHWTISLIRKKMKWFTMFRYVGLGVGYLLCFFAPGNFNRRQQSHDAITTSYGQRLSISFNSHLNALNGTKGNLFVISIVLLLACVAVVILVAKRKKEALKEAVLDVAPFMAAGVASILIWAIAPHTPMYGLDFWILTATIVLMRFVVEMTWPEQVKIAVALVVLVLFCSVYSRELYNYGKVSFVRRFLVKEALDNNLQEVVVPAFDNTLSNERYMLGYLNGQAQYDSEHYMEYYGIRLVISN